MGGWKIIFLGNWNSGSFKALKVMSGKIVEFFEASLELSVLNVNYRLL